MILYETHGGVLGAIPTLARFHGSAAYKAALPSLFSTGMLFLYQYWDQLDRNLLTVTHPYSIGAFIAFYSFLLVFHLNYSYGRYMEGATTVHTMISKILDCGVALCSFHYQSNLYDSIRPPSLGGQKSDKETKTILKSHTAKGRYRSLERLSVCETINRKDEAQEQQQQQSPQETARRFFGRRRRRDAASLQQTMDKKQSVRSINSRHSELSDHNDTIPIPARFQEQFFKHMDKTRQRGLPHTRGYRNIATSPQSRLPVPSLFLQEAAHLISLLTAVALSTLRNDMDQGASFVVPYVPGKPWPPVDPDHLSRDIQREYGDTNAFWKWFYFALGLSRSQRYRTLYNAARPFGVLGGCSDSEISMLQAARGPAAKVALVKMWLEEFITRECQHGSTGDIPGPILSRLYQFISDGLLGYNQARKVAYIPFPFPHSQIVSLFSLVVLFVFPLLYVKKLWLAGILNFFTTLCFLGLEETARELVNPFLNAPNDLPLVTFQAEMNEALVTMYAGFHPDAWGVTREDSIQEKE